MSTSFANPFLPQNPFFSPDILVEEEATAVDARDFSYALVKNGPAVSSDEVESHLDTVEVKVSWGTQVLALTHLESGKGFSIGEDADFACEMDKTEVVSVRGTSVFAVVPRSASATVRVKGEADRIAAGGEEIALRDGMSITMDVGAVTVEIASTRAGKKIPVGFLAALASGAAASIGLSFLGHTAIVASMAMFMPNMQADDAESISRDQILKMQALMDASAQREDETPKDLRSGDEATGGGSTGGEPHKGEQGAAGTQTSKNTDGRMSFKGHDAHDQLSKADELKFAATEGMVGMLNSGISHEGPASPWGDDHMGTDADNHIGKMFGSSIDDAFGFGVGLYGNGEGGGGNGAGIGIDGVGNAIGGGGNGPGKWGVGHGDKDGWGNSHGKVGGSHVTKAPIMHEMTLTSNGRLPAEVIQRIVRQNFGRFRMCYEQGLRNNPSLSGRVVTKFVIGRDGAVSQASDGGSDLPNQEVVSCVVRSFNVLSFPQPEGGIATVTYPIALNPAD